MTLKFVQDAMGTKWKEIIYFEISIYMYLAKWCRKNKITALLKTPPR